MDTGNTAEAVKCPPPDPATSMEALEAFGFTNGNRLPLTKSRALELLTQGCTIYLLYEGNTDEIAMDPQDIQEHDGMFGIDPEEWERICKRADPAYGMEDDSVEKEFLEAEGDRYAIYRLCDCDLTKEFRFQGSETLRENGIAVDRSNFYPVYTARLPGTGEPMMLAELVFDRLNMGLPLDFHGYSPSVGDIIAIKSHGAVSFFYVEQIGFSELPHFLEPENYLKNAEMAEEDDLGMIDGIINNGKKPDIADLERRVQEGKAISVEELAEAAKQARDNAQDEPPRQSLLDKLHHYQEEQKTPTAAPKLAERNQEKC